MGFFCNEKVIEKLLQKKNIYVIKHNKHISFNDDEKSIQKWRNYFEKWY